jgi:PAS domain S-box-containing protein
LRLANERGRYENTGWRLQKNGSRFWANMVITSLTDGQGALLGYTLVTRDLTEQVHQKESLRTTEERLHLLIDNVFDYAIFMLDTEGRIASWNTGAQRLYGYTAAENLGQHFSRFYPPEAVSRQWPEHELRAAIERGRLEDEGWRIRKDGSRFWANVVVTPMYDSDRKLRGFAKVTRDLTERSRVLAMQDSQQHMDEFLAMLGHELRNPLGAIRNAAQLVKKLSTNETLDKASTMLDRQIRLMNRLIEDLLDVARIRQGRLTLRPARIQLQPLLEQAVESVPLIREKQLSLTMDYKEPLGVIGDSERLIQVFANVLHNAAKYTDVGGSVSINAFRDQDEAVVCIKDTGKGIDPELLPNVFDLFRQGERTLHNAHGGLGIGLTLVQRILDLHGGTVKAFSCGENQGSEFITRLPLAR